MSRFPLVAVVAGVLVLSLCSFAFADVSIPNEVTYKGTAVDESGSPIHGSYDLVFRYLDIQGANELLIEKQSQVKIIEGDFAVKLGSGTTTSRGSLATLQEVFELNPEVLMEVSIDGRVQNPWIRILPAGHSQATAAALSGPVGADNETLHWKGYESKSPLTAVQAVVLAPADNNSAGPIAVESDRFTNPMLADMVFLGESIAVRDLPATDYTARPDVEAEEVNRPRHEVLFDDNGQRFGTTTEKVEDTAASRAPSSLVSPAPILNFEGVGNVNGVLPPDTEGTVGPNHYVQVVNLSFAIYDKTGTQLQAPRNTNTLWTGFGGACQNDNSGDAIFLYDQPADRYVLTQFAVGSAQAVCFAVSTTPDPTGTFYLYRLDAQRFPDYYKLGVWPDSQTSAYYMTTNSGFPNQYDVYAIDRDSLLAGTTPRTAQFFQGYVNLFMPADVEGTAPPAITAPEGGGSPGLLYTFRDGGEPYFGSPPTDSIDIWEYAVDWDTPANSTFTLAQSITPADGLAEFNWTVCGFFVSNCLPQPDTSQGIDSASWWPMQRLVYRNFGTHETLLGSWTVDVNGTPDLAAPRWFELRRPIFAGSAPEGTPWTIYQQGTYSPDANHRFMPSIGMDGDGNIAIGYSVTSDTVYPSIRYAVRAAGDPLGTLQAEAELIAGTGSQTHSSARWGDYSSMELDPVDECTFWFTTEYIETTGSAPWQTRVGTFQVPGCGGLQVSPSSQSVCSTAGSVDYGITLLDTFTGTTNLTADPCPGGANLGVTTCSFNPNPVVNPQTTSTFTISDLFRIAGGEYPVTITATDNSDPSITRDAEIALNLFDGLPGLAILDSPANEATGVERTPTLTWLASSGAESYLVQLARDPAFTDLVINTPDITGLSFDVSPALEPLTTYYWRVIATNPCGDPGWLTWSFTTEAIPAVLLVDDDNDAPDVRPTYSATLDALGVDYDVWNTQNSASEPTAEDLAPYSTVLWFSGAVFSSDQGTPLAGPTDASEVALGSWLDGATLGSAATKCFGIFSQDYGWDQGGPGHDTPTAFMDAYLNIGTLVSDVTQTVVTGSGGLFNGLGPFTLDYPFSNFSDTLSPNAGGELAFSGNQGDAAVNSPTVVAGPASYRTAYFGFPIEAIASAGDREAVMDAFLNGCQLEPSVDIFSDGFESGDTTNWTLITPLP